MNNENCTSCSHWDLYVSCDDDIDKISDEEKEIKPNNCSMHLCGSDKCPFNRNKRESEPYGTWLDGRPSVKEELVSNNGNI